jgi:voltage-gated potassium channel
MIALPVGIIATAFSDEAHRRVFVVISGMVAGVTLFVGVQAGDIADIMRLLPAQQMEPKAIIEANYRRNRWMRIPMRSWG